MTKEQVSMFGLTEQPQARRRSGRVAIALRVAASILVPALGLAGCGNDADDSRAEMAGGAPASAGEPGKGGSTTKPDGGTTTATGGKAGAGGNPDAPHAGAGGAGGVSTELVAEFDLSKGQLPEGIAIRDGVPYVGFAGTGEIAKVDLAKGTAAIFATLPKPVPNAGFMTGLAFSKQAPTVLYAELVSFAPEVQPGIYRVDEKGGAAELFASDPAMVFPNGLVDDKDGNWFVADSAAGVIFKISASGKTVEKWAADELLVGDSESSCAKAAGAGVPFAIGANGIVQNGTALYVTNTDKGLVARIPIGASNAAGKVTVFAGPDCDLLGGADGITSLNGALFVANNFRNELVRLDAMGNVTTVASGEPLDFPATPVFDHGTLWVTNFAFMNAQAGKGSPGLIKIEGAAD